MVAVLTASAPLPAQAAIPPAVTFVKQRVERREPGCKKPPSECSTILLEYPRFTKAPTAAALGALNKAVSDFILESFQGARLRSATAVVDDFFREAAAVRRDVPQMPAWYLEKTVSVDYNARGIVSLDLTHASFTGGAHPNAWTTQRSYAAQTGRRLTLRDLLVPGFEPKLNPIAERYFRRARDLKPTANLEAEGFTFKGGKFAVNDNFMITSKGLAFHFDSYEVAPYVVGPTDFLVPYAAIRHLIRSGGPLAAVLR